MMQKYTPMSKDELGHDMQASLSEDDDGICYLASEVDAEMKKKDEELAYCYEENRKTGMDSVRWAQLAGDNQREVDALKAEKEALKGKITDKRYPVDYSAYLLCLEDRDKARADNSRQAEKIERLRDIVTRVSEYAQCCIDAFQNKHAYLDMTGFPTLIQEAQDALTKTEV